MGLKTPVAFMVFNRPDTTERVFAAIRQAQPEILLVVADGPRLGRPGEAERCSEVRAIIAGVDWPCEVSTNYSETNLGCKLRVSSGLDWVFSQVEEAIILEDDCLPHPSFFPFCQAMLARYRDDERVMMIGGTNYLLDTLNIPETYCFSRYFPIWGWASWRRAWKRYDITMDEWPRLKAEDSLKSFYSQRFMQRHVSDMFDGAWAGSLATWDIQWFYSCLFNNSLCIIPRVNVISNIGLVGTHTSGDTSNNSFPTFDLATVKTVHPAMVLPSFLYDGKFFSKKLRLGLAGMARKVYFACRKKCRNAVQYIPGREK
jgi:hypothetical protein